MINVEAAVMAKFPQLVATPALLRKPAMAWLRHIVHETEINSFIANNADVSGFAWIDRVFEYLNFSYAVSARDRANIPASGKVVIFANHPIGSLDGLALLRLISEVRSDVKIIANDLLSSLTPIQRLLIPVDNMTGGSALRSYRRVLEALDAEQAVIVFPAGEVSRASPFGVRDGLWQPGFIHFARKSGAPVLPVLIKARNSLMFYSASILFKPISTMLLSSEMFKHQSNVISFHVGEPIPAKKLYSDEVPVRNVVKRLRKYLYKLERPQPVGAFETERTIAHPEDRQLLQQELKQGTVLGTTRDNNAIILFDWFPDSVVIRELGRLREVAFRQVGEGSGKRRDLDRFDEHYRHLVLWDKEALEVAGAYRIGEGAALLERFGESGFYTHTLYRYQPEFMPYLQQGIELGRSFVNPKYWGKASLDYLWQGLGAYLAQHPEVRYLFGPVSISAAFPKLLVEELVYFFTTYYGTAKPIVTPLQEFALPALSQLHFHEKYNGQDVDGAFALLQESFQAQGLRIPVLFKQYTAQYEPGGFHTLAFSIDPDFADCIDGFCLADLGQLKASKRKRYIG
jgi:putative hemolysin